MTAAFGNSYGYDANGNQTSRTIGGVAYTFTFDYENRITEVKQGTTGIATFVYDADGNRVKGTVSGVTTVYVAGVYEYQGGATTKYYEGNAMRRTNYASGNGVQYLLRDHLGSSSVIVNQDGTVAKSEFYYPYGGNRGAAFSTLTTKRFTGQYHESGLPGGEGLSYYNARWYDAQLGRFVSADTVVPDPGNPQSLNRLAYVFNNPLVRIDPSGHDPWWIEDRLNSSVPTDSVQTLVAAYYDGSLHNAIRPRAPVPIQRRASAAPFSSEQLDQLSEIAKQVATAPIVFDNNGQIDWKTTLESGLGDALSVCGKLVNGVCGISPGFAGSFVAVGASFTTDLVVDKNGEMAVYLSAGGGGYATFSGFAAHGRGNALMVATNASVDDMGGWTVHFGGSGYSGTGVMGEWITGKNSNGEAWHGAVLSTPMNVVNAGWGAEIHASATHSWPVYQSNSNIESFSHK